MSYVQSSPYEPGDVKCDNCGDIFCSCEEFREDGLIISGFCEIEIKDKGRKHFCSKDCFRKHMLKNLFQDDFIKCDELREIHCGEGGCNNVAEFLVDASGTHKMEFCKEHLDAIRNYRDIEKIVKIIH